MPFAKMFQAETEGAMADVAAALAPQLASGAMVALDGNLGAGKSALARALIRHFAGNPDLEVPSPTFTLVQTYETPGLPIWHFDFYRLKSADEIFELGWEEALASKGLLLMEWAERTGPYLPAHVTRITITPDANGVRQIEVRA